MNQLAITKRIAQIEKLDYSVEGGDCFVVRNHAGLSLREIYNPFDDAINHRLVVKYDVVVDIVDDKFYPEIDGSQWGEPVFYDDYNLAVLSIIIKKHATK